MVNCTFLYCKLLSSKDDLPWRTNSQLLQKQLLVVAYNDRGPAGATSVKRKKNTLVAGKTIAILQLAILTITIGT